MLAGPPHAFHFECCDLRTGGAQAGILRQSTLDAVMCRHLSTWPLALVVVSAGGFLPDLLVLSRLSRMVRSPIVAAISYVVYNYSCRPQVLLMPHLCPIIGTRLSCSLSFLQSLPCLAQESADSHV